MVLSNDIQIQVREDAELVDTWHPKSHIFKEKDEKNSYSIWQQMLSLGE